VATTATARPHHCAKSPNPRGKSTCLSDCV
jgi:hypothetical protein